MYNKILVPLDGSELAEAALPYAEELAGRLGSEIKLICVSESAEDQHIQQYDIKRIAKTTKDGAEKYLREPEGREIKVEPVILTGHPAEEIVNYAGKENIGLIVMATHGWSGIKRWTLGSVADKVVRATKQPVALIRAKGDRPQVRDMGMLNNALVPLDGSKESEAVIPYIEELASKLQTEIVLFQVMEPAYHTYAGGEGAVAVSYTKEEMEPLKANAKEYLEKIGNLLEEKGITTMSEVRVGKAADEIVKLADEIHADIVAMSTHGRSGISRWAFGSVADKVLRGANTPVLLVRAPGSATE